MLLQEEKVEMGKGDIKGATREQHGKEVLHAQCFSYSVRAIFLSPFFFIPVPF
jgi:hypothetical protein